MPNLKVPPKEAVRLLAEKVAEIQTMRRKREPMEFYDFIGWSHKTHQVIDGIYPGDDIHVEDIRSIGAPGCSCGSSCHAQDQVLSAYEDRLLEYIAEIDSERGTEGR